MTDDQTRPVLERMDPGRVYGRRELDELFYEHTDVRFGTTIRQRLKQLVAAGELEIVAIGQFQLTEDEE